MFDNIKRMLTNESTRSKDVAKERLRLILVHDRMNVSPQFMQAVQKDMIEVITKYMDINEREMEVHLTSTNSSVTLVANIPVNRMKNVNPLNE